MAAKYSNKSPWFLTTVTNGYLDVLKIRAVSSEVDDFLYTIESQYTHRPDLLAYDLYGDAALWWVFAVRNPNTLKNPLGDFLPGVTINIPKKSTIAAALGL